MRSTGIRVAASSKGSTEEAVSELQRGLGPGPFQHLIVFFSKRQHDALNLSTKLTDAFPAVPVSGCSTAGEITPIGITQGGLVAIAFPLAGFHIFADVIENPSVEQASKVAKQLKEKIDVAASNSPDVGLFAILLTEGISRREEFLVGAIAWELGNIPLVGGSAGDDEIFDVTEVLYGGTARVASSVLIVGSTTFPFRTFSTHNLKPKPVKLVVTQADPDNRVVVELNGKPAATEYAAASGLDPEQLKRSSFASFPLAVKIGDNYYCRSIRKVNSDNSLLFACAVEEGLVFTAVCTHNIVDATASVLAEIKRELIDVDVIIGFDCIFRRLDAEVGHSRHLLETLYRKHKVVGFHTYGEQFNGLHLNQTLTGIAFGIGNVHD